MSQVELAVLADSPTLTVLYLLELPSLEWVQFLHERAQPSLSSVIFAKTAALKILFGDGEWLDD